MPPTPPTGPADGTLTFMSATDLHTKLQELESERALAHLTGVADVKLYMRDLEREIARSRSAWRGAAVTEIASFRAQLSGPQLG
jgi:hypothetical protein